jgi:uncharacterized protein (DUF302 family)
VSDVSYGRTVLVDGTVAATIPKVKDALKDQGFGVLTEIDVQATLREKIGAEVAPYVILGACNPTLANRALQAEPEIGLLLPCNVVVREHEGKVAVSALDPQVMSEVTGHPDLPPIVDEATAALDAALEVVAAG